MIELTSAADVIAKLGGDIATARRYSLTPQAVRNWRYDGGIPPGYRPHIDRDLRRLGARSAKSAYRTYKVFAVRIPQRRPQRGQ